MTKDEANALLIGAAEKGLVSDVQSALAAGADAHADDDYALNLASYNGHTEVIKILIEAGADVHADDDYALRMASNNGHAELVKILIDVGADIHALDDHALAIANRKEHAETVKILIEAGRWDEKCDDGCTYFERFKGNYPDEKLINQVEKYVYYSRNKKIFAQPYFVVKKKR